MWRAAAASCLLLIKNPKRAPRRSSTSPAWRPNVFGAARCIVYRDLLLALRRRSDVATALLFFVIVTSLFPLGIAAAKALAHWLVSGLPLVLIAPLIALQYDLPAPLFGVLALSLLLGTPVLSMIGAIGAALT